MQTRCLSAELQAPDPVGRDLARYRTRVYRFTEDRRHYVLAEQLEERFLQGIDLTAQSRDYVRTCLTEIRATGRVPHFEPAIAEAEHIDLAGEFRARQRYRTESGNTPERVVAIVGAPRSGTSHLYNLLARVLPCAYFTTVSCWAWPTRNLTRPGRQLFTRLGDGVFATDNKNTRLLPGLVMPYESEDVYARAMPTYRHIAGHHYELRDARPGRYDVLTRAVSAHLGFFSSNALLTKSPFNSLRIRQLEELWGDRLRYLHIIRDRHGTADSMRRNRFEFTVNGVKLSAEDARDFFVHAVCSDAPPGRTYTLTHTELVNAAANVINGITAWLSLR